MIRVGAEDQLVCDRCLFQLPLLLKRPSPHQGRERFRRQWLFRHFPIEEIEKFQRHRQILSLTAYESRNATRGAECRWVAGYRSMAANLSWLRAHLLESRDEAQLFRFYQAEGREGFGLRHHGSEIRGRTLARWRGPAC